MNNLAQSNVIQLCAIVVSDLFAITIAGKIKDNRPLDNWDGFIERANSFIKMQLGLSLNPPKTKKLKDEWYALAEQHTKRLSENLINTFLLGLQPIGEIDDKGI
jgi:hypothetical protein